MINPCNVSSGQISVRFLWFVLMLSFPLVGWVSEDLANIKNTESVNLKMASEAMQRIELLDMVTVAPDSWQAVPPSSNMRLAQFVMPDDGQSEVIVFYFGARQGGGPEANIARWVGQFRPVNGKPVQPMVTKMKTIGGFRVTWVEIQGDYARGVGVGPIGEYKSDQMLIAAIAKTPRGNLYIQFHGDREAVLEHRDEFAHFVLKLQNRSV